MTHMLRTRWAAIGAAVAVTVGLGGGFGLARATITSGERAAFVPITPCRLFKTNAPTIGPRTTPLGADETVTFPVTGAQGNCTIPASASAVVITLVGLNQTANTFLTAFPADAAQPTAATMNLAASATGATSSLATIKLSPAGAMKLFNKNGTINVIADITGYYEDHNHDDRYYTETEVNAAIAAAVPAPVVSTTAKVGGTGGGAYDLPCPAGAVAVGLRGRVATFEIPGINVVSVACRVVVKGRVVVSLGASSDTDDTGGAQGGGAFNLICPSGSIMTGVSGMTRNVFGGFATVVTDLTVHCANIGTGEASSVGPVHGVANTPFALTCAAGSHVVGIGPASGDQLLDSLRLKCST